MGKTLNSKLPYALRDKYQSLAPREQIFVILGSVLVIVFLLFYFVYAPINIKRRGLESAIKNKADEFLRLKTVVTEYKQIGTAINHKRKEEGGPFNLFAFLEDTANESGLMDKIDYMKPGTIQLDSFREEKWVEVKLRKITMKELTDYLHKLQFPDKGIYMKRMSARKEGDYLNLVLQPAVIETR